MSDQKMMNIEFSGWKAIVAIVILIAIVGFRIVSINNKENDTNLMEKVRFELMTDYFPGDVERLKTLVEAGDEEAISKAAQSISTTKININAISASYSVFNFSTKKKDVVVKVAYSIDDSIGTRKKGTKYYLFKHSPMFNRWEYRNNSYALRYYLNYI